MFEARAPSCIEVKDTAWHRGIATGGSAIDEEVAKPFLPAQSGVELAGAERCVECIPPAGREEARLRQARRNVRGQAAVPKRSDQQQAVVSIQF
jgi:hypothetical protein